MYAFLIVVHIIVSISLILVILLQAGRGGGLSESFGVSSGQTFFGTSATKFLQRATSVCAVVFLLTCLSLAALSTHKSRSLMQSQRMRKVIEDLAKEQSAPPAQEAAKTGAPAEAKPQTQEIPTPE